MSLVALTDDLLVLDTEAFAGSPESVSAHSAGRWSTDGFTTQDNAPLIRHHESEHEAGLAFAYAVLAPNQQREFGCAYLRPLDDFLNLTSTRLPAVEPGSAVLSFWAIDDSDRRPTVLAMLNAMVTWVNQWDAASVVLRCRDAERHHVAAAQQLALPELRAWNQPLEYRWFQVR